MVSTAPVMPQAVMMVSDSQYCSTLIGRAGAQHGDQVDVGVEPVGQPFRQDRQHLAVAEQVALRVDLRQRPQRQQHQALAGVRREPALAQLVQAALVQVGARAQPRR